jgi:hypothetical protein
LAVTSECLALKGLVQDSEVRTWTVVGCEAVPAGNPRLSRTTVGFAFPDARREAVVAEIRSLRGSLPVPVLLVSVGREAASVLLLHLPSGRTETLLTFAGGADGLAAAGFEPFDAVPFSAAAEQSHVRPEPLPANPPAKRPFWRSPHWFWGLALIAVAAGSWQMAGWRAASVPVPAPVRVPSGLGMQVSRESRDLLVRWDASLTRSALSGVLKISEGDQRFAIPLSKTDLAAGRLSYPPLTGNVGMELAIETPAGWLTDAVRVIFGEGGTTEVRAQTAEPHTETPVAKVPSGPRSGVEPEPAAAAARRRFTEPAVRTATPVVSFDAAPPPVAVAQTLPMPGVSLPQISAPPPTAQRLGPAFQPPVPVKQVRPTIPNALRQAVFSIVVVDVVAAVDANGNVTSVRTQAYSGLSGHLADFARNAAKGWKFQPARRDGQAVASEYLITFRFSRSR